MRRMTQNMHSRSVYPDWRRADNDSTPSKLTGKNILVLPLTVQWYLTIKTVFHAESLPRRDGALPDSAR